MRLLTDEELRLVSGGYTPPKPSYSQAESDNSALQTGLNEVAGLAAAGYSTDAYDEAVQVVGVFNGSTTGAYLSYTVADMGKDLDQLVYTYTNRKDSAEIMEIIWASEKEDGITTQGFSGATGSTGYGSPGNGGTGSAYSGGDGGFGDSWNGDGGGSSGDAGGGTYC